MLVRSIIIVLGVLLLQHTSVFAAEISLPTSAKPNSPAEVYARHQVLAGTWYEGTSTVEGNYRQHVMRRFPNGEFRVEFIITSPDGVTDKSIEIGNWGVTGSMLVTLTTVNYRTSRWQRYASNKEV